MRAYAHLAGRRTALAIMALALLGCSCVSASISPRDWPVLELPERSPEAPGGNAFAARIATLSLAERESELRRQILSGNVPGFMRRLCPVQASQTTEGEHHVLTFFATPEYLAIGSDADYLIVPMSPGCSQALADALRCSLPTRKMVDDIYSAAELKLAPAPIPPSAEMTTVAVFSNHNANVWRQRTQHLATHPLGALVAGHKKDVVLAAGLAASPGKVAIYGWHQRNGKPIQPLYLGHSASWVDYSQCVRLVSQSVIVDGQPRKLSEVLAAPELAGLLSDEGVLVQPRYSTNTGLPSKTVSPGKAAVLPEQATPSAAFESSRWFGECIAQLK